LPGVKSRPGKIITWSSKISLLKEHLAFRGGTALHKLYFEPQPRYSEDIDLVQISSGPIGDILSLVRERLSFLGEAKYERASHSNKLVYRIVANFIVKY